MKTEKVVENRARQLAAQSNACSALVHSDGGKSGEGCAIEEQSLSGRLGSCALAAASVWLLRTRHKKNDVDI